MDAPGRSQDGHLPFRPWWEWRRLACGCACLLYCVAGSPDPSLAAENRPSEYAVKAAFLYNFTKFVEWPAAAFASDQSPFLLCVLGDDPFGGALDAVGGKPVGARTIALRRLSAVDQAAACHMVFVSSGADDEGRLRRLRGKAILTVGDAPGFASRGGVIGFVLANGFVRFEINPQAAAQAHLSIQSQLLNVASIVRGGE